MTITWPSNTADIIDEMRNAIGRDVVFVVDAGTINCPTCSLDPITQSSTDSFCPTCSGLYYIPVLSGISVVGHVTWGKADILNWQSGGQLFDGDCRIQIKYNDTNLSIVEDVQWIEIDGKQLEIKNVIYRGVRELNRILIDCKERDDNV